MGRRWFGRYGGREMKTAANALSRESQISEALALTEALREQGWKKVSIAITRGGTYRVEAEAGDGSVKAKHDWRP